ncbi:MAG: FmdB family zinc ribbon protein [Candidatus Omnitrophota bacterium]
MPTYEYKCEKCGKIFEEFQSITAAPVKKCKFCTGKVHRLISSGSGFILKGAGFYATDYRKPDYKRKAEKEGSDHCSAGKKSSCPNCPNSGK